MIESILERTSVRNFKSYKLTKKDLDLITRVINSTPTSTNSHQFSAIIITDHKLKNAIAKINSNQKHIMQGSAVIVFVGDRYRINSIIDPKIIASVKNKYYHFNEYTRMIVDAIISASTVHVALNQLGYGVTYIGGLQVCGNEVVKLLNLPKNTFVVTGLSFGKPFSQKKISPKPKLNKVFINQYNQLEAKKQINQYINDNAQYFYDQSKKSYSSIIKNHFLPDNIYFKNFVKSGKYLNKFLKTLK